MAALLTGAALYIAALWAMGESWRFTIDRERQGDLVTGGVFARSRNPIYVGLVLLAIGSALVVGVVVTVAATLVVLGYFPLLIRREERFLAKAYGAAYDSYRARVRRYWTF